MVWFLFRHGVVWPCLCLTQPRGIDQTYYYVAGMPEDYHVPELFSYESESGFTMYGMLYRPHDFEPGRRYPTVMFVYGGPQVQLVTNAYKGARYVYIMFYN